MNLEQLNFEVEAERLVAAVAAGKARNVFSPIP
jgi:hypothetical protein